MIRAPTNLRETTLLLGRLAPRQDVADLFAQVDWSGVSRRQLIHAFLDRPPATGEEAEEPAGFDPGSTAQELFASTAFRAGLATRLLQHFPARRRILFVHVPKAAGTDFMAAMRSAYPWLTEDFSQPDLFTPALLADRLSRFARAIPKADSIFLGGHVKLARYLDDGIFRFQDRLFAVVREPREICLSFANYVMKRFAACPDLSAPDVRSWAGVLRMNAQEIAAIEPHTLALAMATRRGIQPINPICQLLGDGTARGTFATLQRAPIEITSMANFGEWLKQEWGIERDERVNVSPKLIGWTDLSAWQREQIEAGCVADRLVYDTIVSCLARSGRLSVTGPEIANAPRC